MLDFITGLLYSIIRISTPIIFIAIGSTIASQSGLLNMAGESMMLASALTGVIFSAIFQNVWLGILCGMLASVIVTLILCFATFVMKVDLYLMSISLNMALTGGTVFVMWMLTGTKANTAGNINSLALGDIDIPLIKDIPVLGAVLSGHNVFTYAAILITFAVWFLLFKTKIGLRMRSIGQNPQAAASVGINVNKTYTFAFVITSIVGSLGGMYLSMGYQNFFSKGLTANRGFIGMAAATIANGQPIGAMLMSFIFGIAYASTNYLTTIINDSYLLMSIPFVLATAVYLLMSAYRSKAENRLLRKNRKKLEAMEAEGLSNTPKQ